ncbi:YhfX family PLP-dependent enzyme [Virgibacillus siamensis]|uniref:YhfX family PLP-dependent enzyme n=1 Tax=Virgibacillus siamensis TaxID=480071 RepID=UPI000985EC97|nr:YhfX family PLP-dependent enzyme [Virgibacillus siamensis]
MFLDVTKRRNPALIFTGAALHQQGDIPPNTYVIDVDSLRENTKKISDAANKYDLELYFMSKQLGRLPKIAKIMADSGIGKAVAVDFDEGKLLADHGIPIGNVGHLVQPGKNQWKEVLSWEPEVVTVFSYERAKQLSEAAVSSGVNQDILLKVFNTGDNAYEGQEGGILIGNLSQMVDRIAKLEGVTIVGITSFPNLQLDIEREEMTPTNNLYTLLEAKRILMEKGIDVKQVNAPSSTSSETIPLLAKYGVTHGEPGHGLTGTTPMHACRDLCETPAIVYATEVSHRTESNYHVIAGGYYSRSNMKGCLVGHNKEIIHQYVAAEQNSPEMIDYYGAIGYPEDFEILIGDTAIFAFRTQIFVTRSHVALVEGIQTGKPRLIHLERKW